MELIGYIYIIECSNGKYYTGSTNDLDKRLAQHQEGLGANFTRKFLPFNLVYLKYLKELIRPFSAKNKSKGGVTKRKQL